MKDLLKIGDEVVYTGKVNPGYRDLIGMRGTVVGIRPNNLGVIMYVVTIGQHKSLIISSLNVKKLISTRLCEESRHEKQV